jgi:hypothetical protein
MKKYIKIYSDHDGYKRVIINDKWGFIDINGNEICKCKYDWVNNFCNGYALVYLKPYYGYINVNGIEIISKIYDNTSLDDVDANLEFAKLLDDILEKYKLKLKRFQKLKTIV